MKKNIINNKSISNEYINNIIKSTNRLVKQLNFLSDINMSFLQHGGSLPYSNTLLVPYNTLLANIKKIIDYYHTNKTDYSPNIEKNVTTLIDTFNQAHPFVNYPDDISLEKLNSLSNIIKSLKRGLVNKKFSRFIKELDIETPDILANLTDLQKIQIYGKVIDERLKYELRRYESLNNAILASLSKLDDTVKKVLVKPS
jgi:hypothetical protein